jgi:hypothetical protein
MSIYDRPTKTLMAEWAKQYLTQGKVFGKSDAVRWFAEHYPKIKSATVRMHVDGMSINNAIRRHHPAIRSGNGYDLFFKLGPDQYRLWVPETDPKARYKEDIERDDRDHLAPVAADIEDESDERAEGSSEFAFEKDLQNYLAKNLLLIEPGLRLYEEEGITGIQYPVGGRFIDILALDKDGQYVVIELKVSKGYDRVIGQLLRYMAWIEKNMETTKKIRGIIVASFITDDLKLACSRIQDVKLIEYEIAFKLRPA